MTVSESPQTVCLVHVVACLMGCSAGVVVCALSFAASGL